MRQLPTSLRLVLCLAVASALPVNAAEDVSPRARALHERILTLDSHLDTPAQLDDPAWDILQRHAPGHGDNQVDYPRMLEGGLDGGAWAIYTPQRGRAVADYQAARDHGLQRLIEIKQLIAGHPAKFELAVTPDDARRIAKSGKRVVFISMENASPLVLDPSLLKFYYDQGLRVLGLVHTSNNEFADSATAPAEWNGISPKGRELVAEANRLGILLDQSHASDAVFDQLLELSKAPIVLTHTSSKAIYNHARNLDDERIRRLAAKGGVIQVNSYSTYLEGHRRDARVPAGSARAQPALSGCQGRIVRGKAAEDRTRRPRREVPHPASHHRGLLQAPAAHHPGGWPRSRGLRRGLGWRRRRHRPRGREQAAEDHRAGCCRRVTPSSRSPTCGAATCCASSAKRSASAGAVGREVKGGKFDCNGLTHVGCKKNARCLASTGRRSSGGIAAFRQKL